MRTVLAATVEPMLDPPVNRYQAGLLGSRHQPRRIVAPPAIRPLDLVTVAYLLPKETELVVDAVGVAGHIQRGQRIEKARRQPSQAAIAESSVGLFVEDRLQVDTVSRQQLPADVDHPKIEQVVFERSPDQEFQR